MNMQAAILHAPGDLRVENVPAPECGESGMVIRVKAALTCGTDQKAFLRGHPKIKIPGPLGHEFSGVVAQVGRSVHGFHEGDPVACVHTGPCGSCFFCGKGQQNLCETLTDRMAYGAYAEYIRIPEHVWRQNCHPLPAGLSFESAALMEPLACCVYGMKQVGLRSGETALILGDGPAALMMTSLVRHLHAAGIGVVGKHATRLSAAQAMGATRTFDAGESDEQIRSSFSPQGPDVVIECVGRAETWRRALALVRPGGRILLYGGCPPNDDIALNAGKLHYGQVTLYSTFHFTPTEVRESLEFLTAGVVPADKLITARVPLAEIGRYFSASAPKDYIKAAFIP